jgi:hypothetical protein
LWLRGGYVPRRVLPRRFLPPPRSSGSREHGVPCRTGDLGRDGRQTPAGPSQVWADVTRASPPAPKRGRVRATLGWRRPPPRWDGLARRIRLRQTPTSPGPLSAPRAGQPRPFARPSSAPRAPSLGAFYSMLIICNGVEAACLRHTSLFKVKWVFAGLAGARWVLAPVRPSPGVAGGRSRTGEYRGSSSPVVAQRPEERL